MLAGQRSLLGRGAPSIDESLSRMERIALDVPGEAWLDLAPGWVTGHEALMEELARSTRWREGERPMYDRVVRVPRRFATLPDDGPGHPLLERMRAALNARYHTHFEHVTMALYRDGNDSVAWHGDYVAREMMDALVATVSLGTPRRFLLRPTGGGASRAYRLGWGDLMVMGGSCQRTWQHAIPKVAHADPRLVIMFRPPWYAPF